MNKIFLIVIKAIKWWFHFYYAIEPKEDTETEHFFIINDIKESIDLDTPEIKQKPAKLFHHLTILLNKRSIEEILNNFEHSSDNYENPLLFDIVNYMGKNTNNSLKDPQQIIDRFLKFGQHFFTFYLDYPLNNLSFDYSTFSFLNLTLFFQCQQVP